MYIKENAHLCGTWTVTLSLLYVCRHDAADYDWASTMIDSQLLDVVAPNSMD